MNHYLVSYLVSYPGPPTGSVISAAAAAAAAASDTPIDTAAPSSDCGRRRRRPVLLPVPESSPTRSASASGSAEAEEEEKEQEECPLQPRPASAIRCGGGRLPLTRTESRQETGCPTTSTGCREAREASPPPAPGAAAVAVVVAVLLTLVTCYPATPITAISHMWVAGGHDEDGDVARGGAAKEEPPDETRAAKVRVIVAGRSGAARSSVWDLTEGRQLLEVRERFFLGVFLGGEWGGGIV